MNKNRRPRTATNGPKKRNTTAVSPKATHTGTTADTPPTSLRKAESSSKGGERSTRGKRDPVFGIDLSSTMWDRYPLVEVVWVDAVATATIEWSDIDEILEEQIASSRAVGYLIEDNQYRVAVVALVNEADAAHAMLIPRGMVHTINVLREPA